MRAVLASIAATATVAILAPAAGARAVAHGFNAPTTVEELCPPAPAGDARCAAELVVVSGSHRPVHPRLTHVGGFTRLFARRRRATPSASSGPAALDQPSAGSAAYVQQAYDMSYLSAIGGAGDIVAIVDAGSYTNAATDLGTYRAAEGLPACTQASGCLQIVNQQGQLAPLPAQDPAWTVEESIDLDAVSALCPNCKILVVATDSNSLDDLDQGVEAAAALGARQISLSWSSNMSGPPPGSYTFAGVATVAATGDGGYSGSGVDAYPAALPGVTAAGGTTLSQSTTANYNLRGFSESAWGVNNGTGDTSGCDLAEAKPDYQSDAGCAGRAYADLSADGNPNTGMLMYNSTRGGWLLAGGTSLSAPLIAAYYAATGVDGSSPAWAYGSRALLNDAIGGSTGSCAALISYICNAVPGYDGPTGNGSISGDVVAGAPGIAAPGYGSGASNGYVASISRSGATLSGGVYPNGAATTVYWQYGPTNAYGQETAPVSVGSGQTIATAAAALTGLAPRTTYHCRLVAVNRFGTSYGYDTTVTPGASGHDARLRAPVAARRTEIAGRIAAGHKLRALTSWRAATRLAYRWFRSTNGGRSWSRIRRAHHAVYRLGRVDRRTEIKVTVVASNAAGSTRSTSRALRAATRNG